VDEAAIVVARGTGPRGEVAVRRRRAGDEVVHELIVNGTFAMDSAETQSEQALAALARPGDRVLAGGLGLGFTTMALLEAGIAAVDVVEIEELLVAWAHDGVTPQLAAVARDPRARLWVADVRSVLTGAASEPRGPWDAILLDVDNGPDFLIHPENAALYQGEALTAAYGRLAPGGILGIWCQGAHPELLARLTALDPEARQRIQEVRRGRHAIAYVIYTALAPRP
jgi:spermidine synthase